MATKLPISCHSFLAEPRPVPLRRLYLLRNLVAGVLALAAVLKLHAAFNGPSAITNVAVAGWELLLTAWLLAGNRREKPGPWPLAASLFTFSAFAGASLHQLIVGSQTCGCFGTWQVDPQWTLLGDIAVVGLVGWAIRWVWQLGQPVWQLGYATTLLALVFLGFSAGMAWESVRLVIDRSLASEARPTGRETVSLGLHGLVESDQSLVLEAIAAMHAGSSVSSSDAERASDPGGDELLATAAFRPVSDDSLAATVDLAATDLAATDLAATDLAATGAADRPTPVGILVHQDGRRWVVTDVLRTATGDWLELIRDAHELVTLPVTELRLGDRTTLRIPSPRTASEESPSPDAASRPEQEFGTQIQSGSLRLSLDRSWYHCRNIGSHPTAEVTFRVRNDGNDPITVARVIPSCGCLQFTAMQGKVIAPGDVAAMSVTVARGAGESFFHSIWLEFLGFRSSPVRLRILGRQDQGLQVVPSLVDFGLVDCGPIKGGPIKGGPIEGGPIKGGPIECGPVECGPVEGQSNRGAGEVRVIRLTETTSDPFRIVQIQVPECLEQQGEIEVTKSSTGLRNYLIRLVVSPSTSSGTSLERLPGGQNEGVVRIKTTSATRPMIQIPFRFRIKSDAETPRGKSRAPPMPANRDAPPKSTRSPY